MRRRAGVAAAALGLAAGLAYGAAPVKTPLPKVAEAGNGATTKPKAEVVPAKEGEFKSTLDGTVQKYMYLLPAGFDRNVAHDLVLAFHGHGSTRTQYMTQDRGECAGVREVAAKHGMILVTPDYRAPAGWMGAAAEADTLQLLAELKKTYKVRRVYWVGASMGGCSVLTFTALHPELVDGVSSQNGTGNFLEYKVDVSHIQEAIRDAFGGRKDETPEAYKLRNKAEYEKRSAEFHAEKFTMPLAITVGMRDGVVPPASALRLGEAVKKANKDVLVIAAAGESHDTTRADTEKALEFVIAAAEKRAAGK